MELQEKSSYLALFCALLLVRSGKASLDKAIRAAPLTGRARRLANQLTNGAPSPPAGLPETIPAQLPNLVDYATDDWRTCIPPECRVPPGLSSQHISHPGAIEEIHLTAVHLRCPVCGSERSFELDLWQRDHLRIRGHIEMPCGYCGTSSLWEPANVSPKERCEILI